jgi:exopolysaccharide biosynthesis polyprenyl glycosylphosphotransferase
MQIHQLMDVGLFALGFWLAYHLRSNPGVEELLGLDQVDPFRAFAWLYLVLIPATPLVLEVQGFYSRPLFCSRRQTAWILFKGCLFLALVLVLALFFTKALIPRWVVLWFAILSYGLVFAKEELVRQALQSKFGRAQYRRRFILAGTESETAQLRAELEAKGQSQFEVLAEIDLNQTPLQRLVELIHEHSANGVILSTRHAYFEQVEAAIGACELEGVEAWVMADFFRTQISRTTLDDFYGRPILVFSSAPEVSWQSVIKRFIDYVGALVLLALSSWVMAIAAILVKATSRGPVLFRQQRSGLNGQPFTIYKFRTMITNAEQFQHELAAMNEMEGPVFKVTNDPRITWVGKWLRKFSIDEFPQLFNVLRGEMSLVGPRPLPVNEVKRFNDPAHRRRLSVKPGLTCLWQISGRNNVRDFRDWVRLDLEYIDNWSLWLDFKILWWTIPVVLTGAGAR